MGYSLCRENFQNITGSHRERSIKRYYKKNYDDAFKRQSSRQHEKMRVRRMLISNYIKDTGDHNTAHIAIVLDIKLSTLLRDIRAMGYKTKAGIIL